MKILLADDDTTIRKMIARALEKKGYSVIVASDGQRAFDVLVDNPEIRLLVTDMQMPSLDGRGLIEKVRSLESFKSLPIMIISGVLPLSGISDLLEIGASRFLPKPLDIAQLVQYATHLTDKSVHEKGKV